MSPSDLPSLLSQFGLAGLIGFMWLTERRAAAAREKQITEAHDRLVESRQHLRVLLAALDQNTRAVTAVELSQRRAIELLERLGAKPAGDADVSMNCTESAGGSR